MKIKMAIVGLLAVFTVTACAFAQPLASKGTKPAGKPGGVSAAKKLDLTEDQITRIKELIRGYRVDVREITKSATTPEAKKTRVAARKAEAKSAIEAVLTPQQREKAAEFRVIDIALGSKAHKKQAMNHIIAKLDLTEAQQTRIKGILQTSHESMKAIKGNTGLTQETRRAQMMEVRKDTMAKVKAVLTPEQIRKIEEMKSKRVAKSW